MRYVSARLLTIFLLAFGPVIVPCHAAPFFRLTMQSQPGDYVGAGQSYYYDDFSSWTVSANNIPMQYFAGFNYVSIPATSGLANAISFNIDQEIAPGYWRLWSLNFRTNNTGKPLEAGTYLGATRNAALLGSPLIDIAGNDTPGQSGRGCDQTFGAFTVTSAPISVTSSHISFAATFEQHCEQATAPVLTGSIVYDSDGPPPEVPEPAQMLPVSGTITAIAAETFKRSRASRAKIGSL